MSLPLDKNTHTIDYDDAIVFFQTLLNGKIAIDGGKEEYKDETFR